MRSVRPVDASVTVGEVGERLGVAPGAVYYLLFFGELTPAPAPDGGVRVAEAALAEYLDRAARSESRWGRLRLDEKVVDVLACVPPTGHHFGAAWMTAYQLALGVQRRHPAVADEIGKHVGGRHAGEPSLARYLANGLSKRIRDRGDRYPVEGAFLSDAFLVGMTFTPPAGPPIESSVVGGAAGLSMFRLRPGGSS